MFEIAHLENVASYESSSRWFNVCMNIPCNSSRPAIAVVPNLVAHLVHFTLDR